jgi:SRSO17 transposase
VPDDIKFKTKAELALEMIINFKNRGFPFGWVGFDGHYGEQPEFLDGLDEKGIIYCGDVPCNTRVWLEKPKIEVPRRKGNRGRKPTKKKLVEGEPQPVKVRKINPGKVHHTTLGTQKRENCGQTCLFCRYILSERGCPGRKHG